MKRDTDTTKWSDPWFRRLSPSVKLAWLYLVDNCDNAGVWKVDWEDLFFRTGTRDLEEGDVLAALNHDKERVVRLNGSKWLVRDFIAFQCGVLSPSNRFHQSVLSLLQSHFRTVKNKALLRAMLGPCQGQGRGIHAPKRKVKVKEEVKVKEKTEEEGSRGEGDSATAAAAEGVRKRAALAASSWQEEVDVVLQHYGHTVGWDSSRNDARVWVARRLGLQRAPRGQEVPQFTREELILAIDRYAAELNGSGKGTDGFRYKVRNFFNRKKAGMGQGYCEDYLAADYTPPTPARGGMKPPAEEIAAYMPPDAEGWPVEEETKP